METELTKRQTILNKKYDNNGLTPEILKEQISINQLRHKHNIPDPSETTYKDWVQ